MKQSIDLIQPRHIYAPVDTTKPGHIWTPTSLLTIASRLITSGCEVRIFDENIAPYNGTSENVGFNIVGVPYVPVIRERIVGLTDRNIFVGGQTVENIGNDFDHLFPNAICGNEEEAVKRSLNITYIPQEHQVSLVPAYLLLSDEVMRLYLSNVFSLYVSQGCGKDCNFCGVRRTSKDPLTGEKTIVQELYREMHCVYEDLDYLFAKAVSFGLTTLRCYISNLDVFQNPPQLKQFAETVLSVKRKYPTVSLKMTGLSRVDSFIRCFERHRDTIDLLREAGYTTVGFGVDGYGQDVWRKIHKSGNFSQRDNDEGAKSVRAISLCTQVGMQPETLMVFGHPNIDTAKSLSDAYDFTLSMYENYGSTPRPHMAKNLITRNDHWKVASFETKQVFFQNPWMFQLLDFCTLATKYTHGSEEFASMANEYFMKIYEIPGNATLPIVPIEVLEKNGKLIITDEAVVKMRKDNLGRYDH